MTRFALAVTFLLAAGAPAGAGTVTYTYDRNGNTVSRTENGVTTEFVFDARDRLVEVRQGGQISARFQYDWRGRVNLKIGAEGIRQYVYDGDSTRVLVEYDEAGNETVRYAWGGRQLVSMTFAGLGTFYPQFDGLGSVVTLVDQAGNVAARYHYDASGNYRFPDELQAHPNRYGFTGHRWQPEIDLYNANARYLDPGIGRFNAADPYPSTINDPATLHRYVYARNAPTRYTDPLGLWEWDKSLEGKSTDAALRQEAKATKDKGRRQEIKDALGRREAFRYGLQEATRAKDALAAGEDRARVERAIAAYGNEGDAPLDEAFESPRGRFRHVRRTVVGVGDTGNEKALANTAGPFTGTPQPDGSLRFDMEARVVVGPDTFKKDNTMADVVAHEGSHVADYRNLHAAILVETRSGVALVPVIGSPSVDLTKYETERDAYRVSASTAQGLSAAARPGQAAPSSGTVVYKTGGGAPGSLIMTAGKENYTLWDASWHESQRSAKRDAAIDQFLAIGKPDGLYGVTPESPGARLSNAPARPPAKEPEP